ncbi:MAG: hypothetical protein O3C45_10760 [Bacteroidetes bacterium]|nr:hypothetical protein [Bacteroidota bacterium]
MIVRILTDGWGAAVKRPGLAGLLYAGNLILGIILSIPILVAFSNAASETGWSPDLASEFDAALWADLLRESGPLVSTMLSQLLWVLPVLYLWKVGSTVGIVHAMRGDRTGSFWEGLGKYAGKAIVLGLPFLVLAGLMVLGIVLLIALLSASPIGEVGQFWIRFVVAPILIVLAVAVVDLMHDFARLELVLRGQTVWNAMYAGMGWFWQSGSAQALYMAWLVIGSLALILPFWADMAVGGLFLAFLLQQALLFVRSMVSVGWLTSEVLLFQELEPGEPATEPSAEFAA